MRRERTDPKDGPHDGAATLAAGCSVEERSEGEAVMRYLSMAEALRRLRAAGLNPQVRTLRAWIREERVRDVWQLGQHTFIYEGELEALIAAERGA